MTRLLSFVIAFGVLVLAASGARAQTMTLTSAEIKDGATIAADQVFKGFGCTGSNMSPSLSCFSITG